MPRFSRLLVAALALFAFAGATPAQQTYTVDPVHSSVVFKSKHAGLGHVWGRFDAFGGSFTLDDADPAKSSFNIDVKADSVNTNQEKRDQHLRTPEFLNAKQFPAITFKSTSVKKGDGNKLDVTGDLTLHGVTKPVTVSIELIGKGEFPKGVARAGIEATFTVKTTEFGMKDNRPGVDDSIQLIVALEGTVNK